ncbi:MAG: hypothetical protein HUJ69_00770, partial [Lachnospiraceae bacterium]|nr:hypothetical protein [Lachnospiraceae bacterium]
MVYLIDYENVGVHGLDGLSKLTEGDEVCIFYSDKADTLTFSLHKKLQEAKATISYRKVETGAKNALDFQLATYLGYLIGINRDNQKDYCVVSKDKGFEALACYWKKQKITVRMVVDCTNPEAAETAESIQAGNPEQAPVTKQQTPAPKKDRLENSTNQQPQAA